MSNILEKKQLFELKIRTIDELDLSNNEMYSSFDREFIEVMDSILPDDRIIKALKITFIDPKRGNELYDYVWYNWRFSRKLVSCVFKLIRSETTVFIRRKGNQSPQYLQLSVEDTIK